MDLLMTRVGAIPHMDGLTVEQAMTRVGEKTEVCPVCRRGALSCICKSHVDVKPLPQDLDPDAVPIPVRASYTEAQKEAMVNEVLGRFYYPRDAYGLAVWLRQHLR